MLSSKHSMVMILLQTRWGFKIWPKWLINQAIFTLFLLLGKMERNIKDSAIKRNEIVTFTATWMESKIWHKWTYLWNRNRLKDIENRLVVAKREGARGVGLGVWDQQMQIIIYRMDKQDPPIYHREPYSISCNKP